MPSFRVNDPVVAVYYRDGQLYPATIVWIYRDGGCALVRWLDFMQYQVTFYRASC